MSNGHGTYGGTDWTALADTLAALARRQAVHAWRGTPQTVTATERHGDNIVTMTARAVPYVGGAPAWAAADPTVTVVRTDDDGTAWLAWADTVTTERRPYVAHVRQAETWQAAPMTAAALADMAARVGGRLSERQTVGLHGHDVSDVIRLRNGRTVTVTDHVAGTCPTDHVTTWAPETWAGADMGRQPRPVTHEVHWTAPTTTERAALALPRRTTMAGRRIGRGTSGAMVRAGVRARRARSAAMVTTWAGTGGTVTMGGTLPAPVDTGDATADVRAERRGTPTRKGWKAGTGGARVRNVATPRVMADGAWRARTGASVAETPDAGRVTVWRFVGWHVVPASAAGAWRTVADMAGAPWGGATWAAPVGARRAAPAERGTVRHWAAPTAARPPATHAPHGLQYVRQTARSGAPLADDGGSVRRRQASKAAAAARSARAAEKRARATAARAGTLAALAALADAVHNGRRPVRQAPMTAAERRIVADMADGAR